MIYQSGILSYGITKERLAIIQQKISLGTYFLSPLEVDVVKHEDLSTTKVYTTILYPDYLLAGPF